MTLQMPIKRLLLFLIAGWLTHSHLLAQECELPSVQVEDEETGFEYEMTSEATEGFETLSEASEAVELSLSKVLQSASSALEASLDYVPILGQVLFFGQASYDIGRAIVKCKDDDDPSSCILDRVVNALSPLPGGHGDLITTGIPGMENNNKNAQLIVNLTSDFISAQSTDFNTVIMNQNATLVQKESDRDKGWARSTTNLSKTQKNCADCAEFMGSFTPQSFQSAPGRTDHYMITYPWMIQKQMRLQDLNPDKNKIDLVFRLPSRLDSITLKNNLILSGKDSHINKYYASSADPGASSAYSANGTRIDSDETAFTGFVTTDNPGFAHTPVYYGSNVAAVDLARNASGTIDYTLTQHWFQNYRNGIDDGETTPYLLNAVRAETKGTIELKVGHYDLTNQTFVEATGLSYTLSAHKGSDYIILEIKDLDISGITAGKGPLSLSLEYKGLPRSADVYTPSQVTNFIGNQEVVSGHEHDYHYGKSVASETVSYELIYGFLTDFVKASEDKTASSVSTELTLRGGRLAQPYTFKKAENQQEQTITPSAGKSTLLIDAFRNGADLQDIASITIRSESDPNHLYTVHLNAQKAQYDDKSGNDKIRWQEIPITVEEGIYSTDINSDENLFIKYAKVANFDNRVWIIEPKGDPSFSTAVGHKPSDLTSSQLDALLQNNFQLGILLHDLDIPTGERIRVEAFRSDGQSLLKLIYINPAVGEIDYSKRQLMSLEDNSTTYYLSNKYGDEEFSTASTDENHLVIEPSTSRRGLLVSDHSNTHVLGMDSYGEIGWYAFHPFDQKQRWQYEQIDNDIFHLYNVEYKEKGLNVAINHDFSDASNKQFKIEVGESATATPITIQKTTSDIPDWGLLHGLDVAIFRNDFNTAMAFQKFSLLVSEENADHEQTNQKIDIVYEGNDKYSIVFQDSLYLSSVDLSLIDMKNWNSGDLPPNTAWIFKHPTGYVSNSEKYPPYLLQSVANNKYLASAATDWKDRTKMGWQLQDAEPGSTHYLQIRPHDQLPPYHSYYSFDDASANDFGVNHVNANVINTVSYVDDGARGDYDKQISFKGPNNYIEIANNSDRLLKHHEGMTFSGWIKMDGSQNDRHIFDVLFMDLSTMSLRIDGGQMALKLVYGGRTYVLTDLIAGPDLQSGHWSHVAMTIDPNVVSNKLTDNAIVSVYLDGVKTSGLSYVINANTENESNVYLRDINTLNDQVPAKFRIGKEFNGQMDDCKLDSKVLTAAEIAAEYKSELKKNYVRYTFDEPGEHGSRGYGVADAYGTVHDPENVPEYIYEWERGHVLQMSDADEVKLNKDYQSLGMLNSDFTIGFWVSPSSFSERRSIFSADNASYLDHQALGLWHDSNGYLVWHNGKTSAKLGNPLTLHKWTHVALVYQKGQTTMADAWRIYFDGVLQNWQFEYAPATAFLNPINANNHMLIGERFTDPNHKIFEGLLDDLTIYGGVALSHSEVTDLYYNQKSENRYLIINDYFSTKLEYPVISNTGIDVSNPLSYGDVHYVGKTEDKFQSLKESDKTVFTFQRLRNADHGSTDAAYALFNADQTTHLVTLGVQTNSGWVEGIGEAHVDHPQLLKMAIGA